MSYRFPVRGGGAPPRLRQCEWHLCFAATAGLAVSFVVGLAAMPVASVPPAIAAVSIIAAMVCGVFSALRYQPVGDVYYPRSDGRWHDLRGARFVDVGHLVSHAADTEAAALPAAFPGGLVAATVSERRSAGRMVPAGYVPQALTLLVAVPGAPSYRTRLDLQLLPEDLSRTEPGQVLLALRFSKSEPDIALLPAGFADSLSHEDRERTRVVLAAALPPTARPDVQIWDPRTRRVLHRGYPYLLSFYRQDLGAFGRDIAARGEWRLWLRSFVLFGVGFVGGAVLAALKL